MSLIRIGSMMAEAAVCGAIKGREEKKILTASGISIRCCNDTSSCELPSPTTPVTDSEEEELVA